MVLNSRKLGEGTCSRSGGYFGTFLLNPFSRLRKVVGHEKAVSAYTEAGHAFDFALVLMKTESIDCQYEQSGRIYWAYTNSPRFSSESYHRENLTRAVRADIAYEQNQFRSS